MHEAQKAASTAGQTGGSEALEKLKESLTTWLFEPESFAPLAKVTKGKTYGIITDHLGTPLSMHTPGGEAVWSATLNCYGEVENLLGKKQDCPFRYPGQYEDIETGLYYNRFRYYAPEEGMYISQDPIGLEGGSKMYSYVPNPNTFVDIFGLSCKKSKNAKKEIQELERKFGAANVHSLDRHGAHTTIQQQFLRANSGILPNGMTSYKTDSARFLSHSDHLEAMHNAIDNFILGNGVSQTSQGFKVEFDMGRDIAEGYLKDSNIKTTTTKIIATFNQNGDLVSMYVKLR